MSRLGSLPYPLLPDRPRLLRDLPDEPLPHPRDRRGHSPSRDPSFVQSALMTPKHGLLLFLVPTNSARNAGLHTRQTRSGPRVNLGSPAWVKIAVSWQLTLSSSLSWLRTLLRLIDSRSCSFGTLSPATENSSSAHTQNVPRRCHAPPPPRSSR